MKSLDCEFSVGSGRAYVLVHAEVYGMVRCSYPRVYLKTCVKW